MFRWRDVSARIKHVACDAFDAAPDRHHRRPAEQRRIFPIVATESAKIFVANAGSMKCDACSSSTPTSKLAKSRRVVLVHRPARQRSGLEPVGQLRIGLNGIERIMRPGGRRSEFATRCQELDDVEEGALA